MTSPLWREARALFGWVLVAAVAAGALIVASDAAARLLP